MDLEDDPKCEAVAAMKLCRRSQRRRAAEIITAALAWSELTRLRGAAADNLAEESPTRQIGRCKAQRLSPLPLRLLGPRSG